MIHNRDRKIVITSQFNINGSRGKDAGKFVSDYISRDSAVDKGLSYIGNPNRVEQQGDGAAFTLTSNGVSRQEVLETAQRVQAWHKTGKRAIQQMVISFDPDYLLEQNLVMSDTQVLKKGDYRYKYDDLRIRNSVRTGLQALVDHEGYNDGQAIACIQWDTRHLHVHAVVYENGERIARKKGYEEKGVLLQSSLNEMAHDIDRNLSLTKSDGLVPSQENLIPEDVHDRPQVKEVDNTPVKMPYVDQYLRLIEEKQRAEALNGQQKVVTPNTVELEKAQEILAQEMAKRREENNNQQL